MKIQIGDYIKVIDWDNCKEEIYQYLGRSDEWYRSKGFSRKLKNIKDNNPKSNYIMLPDAFLERCEIKVINLSTNK